MGVPSHSARLLQRLTLAARTLLLVSVAFSATACGGEGSTVIRPFLGLREDVRIHRAGFDVQVDASTLSLTMSREGTPLLRFPIDAFQLGAVDEVTDSFNYDPYLILVDTPFSKLPPGLRWLVATQASLIASRDGVFELELLFQEGKRALLRVAATADGRFRCQLTPAADGVPVALIRLVPQVDSNEGFYGLGEYFDAVNHRGKVRAMQFEIDGSQESGYNEAHVPIPLIIGTRGWGLFVESFHTGVFDVASSRQDRVDVAFGLGPAASAGLTFHLLGADHPLDVTRHYYELTGYPRLPARWALGPWLWRDENEDQVQVESDIQTMRDLDLPASGIWIDRPYASAVNSFDFDPAMFTDAQAMIDFAREQGFRMALWHTPYLDQVHEATRELHEEALARGYYPPTPGILANSWGNLIDFTNPDAYMWWQNLIRRYTDMGIEFKLDYAEDIVPGIMGARNVWEFHDGRDERTMHAEYQLLYHRVYGQTLPKTGGLLLCRAGTIGDQVSVSAIWPGDLDANMAKHKEVVQKDGKQYNAVGGLPAAVVASLTLGPSGFPFFGSDTGGYRHSPTDKETFTRWFQHTALSTVMQIGTSTNEVAWEFKEGTGFDQEMLDWYRTYTRLHIRLFPYEWTHAKRIAEDGRPILRAIGLAYPELEVHPDDIYLFGDDLLVAPVVERGARTREVIFPPGAWFDWWDGTRYEGSQTTVVDAPLSKLPLFLREGGIIPMLRPTIDTMAPTTRPYEVDSYATTPGILHVRMAPGTSHFRLFDGSELAQQRTDGKLVLSATPGSEFVHGVLFEVMVATPPTTVTEGETAMMPAASWEELQQTSRGWYYDPSAHGGIVYVKAQPGEREVTIAF